MTTLAPSRQPTLRAPLQARSRATLERIYAATERLLEHRPFQQITVQQIVREARTSVGSFYARFADKDALLPALHGRYDRDFDNRLRNLRRRANSETRTLAQTARGVANLMVDWFTSQRYLQRALALYVRMHPEKTDAETHDRRRKQMQFLFDGLASHRDEIRHPHPDRAIEMGVFFVVTACRERILFAESTQSATLKTGPTALKKELTHMLLGYLQRVS